MRLRVRGHVTAHVTDAVSSCVCSGGPPSLSRLCRVAVRKSLGPSRLGLAGTQLSSLNLPPQVLDYLRSVLEVCEGDEVRRKAVEGITVIRPMVVER